MRDAKRIFYHGHTISKKHDESYTSYYMRKIISWIGVKEGEEKLAAMSAFYASLIGLSQVWLKTIPISLFLANFNADTLPYAYIVSAIVLVCLGLIYSRLERKTTATRLLYIFLVIPALTFFIFWIFLETWPGKWLYLLLFIGASASFDIFDLELWGDVKPSVHIRSGETHVWVCWLMSNFGWHHRQFSTPLSPRRHRSKQRHLSCKPLRHLRKPLAKRDFPQTFGTV